MLTCIDALICIGGTSERASRVRSDEQSGTPTPNRRPGGCDPFRATSVWQWRQVVAGDDLGQPVGFSERKLVALSEFADHLEIDGTGGGHTGQLAEEVLKSGR